MGTNLSQVFVANTANFQAPGGQDNTDLFNDLTTAEVGVWNVPGIVNGTGTNYWLTTKLFEKTFAISDTNAVVNPSNFANPAWLYNRIQFAQGTAGNPIATPIINTANIKRIKFDPYLATAGHKVVLGGTPASTAQHTVKFIFRTTPTDQLSFYDQNGSNAAILSGTAPFPLGAFNTTNHKVISVELAKTDGSAILAEFGTLLKAAVESHELLKDLLAVSTTSATGDTYTAKHVGVIFDMIIWNDTADAASAITLTTTAFVPGVGNPWQVLGEEIRCRSRYGNFNRMYLPQNMPTYTNTANKYHKVTIEYATNWPTSTGIAPAGANNQVILYVGGSTALAAGDTNLDAVFNLANVTGAAEYIWF
jgi:hypothetical protein